MINHDKKGSMREYLPWYVNGTLDEKTRQSVESAIAASPALKAEVNWLQSLQSTFKEDDTLSDIPETVGLANFNALLKNEQQGKVISLKPSRWQEWQRPLMAVAATVMVVQMGVIGTLINNKSEPITTLSGETTTASQANMSLAQVTFNNQATTKDIQRVLNSIGAEIVGGPSALGIYTIQLPNKDVLGNLSKLRKDTAIESVSQVVE